MNKLTAGRPSTTKNKAATLASLSDNSNLKRVNFELSQELHAKLKVHAIKNGKTIRDLLTEFVKSLPST